MTSYSKEEDASEMLKLVAERVYDSPIPWMPFGYLRGIVGHTITPFSSRFEIAYGRTGIGLMHRVIEFENNSQISDAKIDSIDWHQFGPALEENYEKLRTLAQEMVAWYKANGEINPHLDPKRQSKALEQLKLIANLPDWDKVEQDLDEILSS